MKTPTSSSFTARLAIALLLAAVPFGAGCVTEVDDGDDDGSDQSALEGDAACEIGDSRECFDTSGMAGIQDCTDLDGELTWSECVSSSASTPLVLAFEGQRVEYLSDMAGSFDMSGLGATIATDWPTAVTPWLALDGDGDGAIGGGEELFGSATRLASGARADNGFSALAELDSNGDGWITAADERWSSLVLWSDADGDRVSSAGELTPLAARGVTGIAVRYDRAPRCDARGNCEVERAAFTFVEGGAERIGAIIDVHLRWQ